MIGVWVTMYVYGWAHVGECVCVARYGCVRTCRNVSVQVKDRVYIQECG